MLNPEMADLDENGKYVKIGFSDEENLVLTIELKKQTLEN